MNFLKFDMHCHTAEGSMDAHVGIGEYIQILKSRGFGGMLVTDHDSYEGYLTYKNSSNKVEDFIVLQGIEYDTYDFGHMLIIMPQKFVPDVIKMRGLTLKKLVKIVHFYGGILGPAHPCGERFLSFFTTGIFKDDKKAEFMKQFDFLEAYNACESEESNWCAAELAKEYGLPGTGGSDAHSRECVGMAYTMLPETIQTEDDLIDYVKNTEEISYEGSRYKKTAKDRLGVLNKVLVGSFFLYNKLGALYRLPARRKAFYKAAYEMGIK